MIFTVQRYLEDYFAKRSLADNDQYAVKLANVYAAIPKGASESEIQDKLHKVRTIFFSVNRTLTRRDFEQVLAKNLSSKFQKKNEEVSFPGGVNEEKAYFKKSRLSVSAILVKFKKAIESRAISPFWESRIKGKLKRKPEDIAQALLTVFVLGILGERKGHVFRELASGIGFVDVSIMLSTTQHLVEIKILTSKFVGVEQLETYMKTEGRKEGWLVILDARNSGSKTTLPEIVDSVQGKVRVIQIDINPTPPSKLSK